jgi:hypothetical protein
MTMLRRRVQPIGGRNNGLGSLTKPVRPWAVLILSLLSEAKLPA